MSKFYCVEILKRKPILAPKRWRHKRSNFCNSFSIPGRLHGRLNVIFVNFFISRRHPNLTINVIIIWPQGPNYFCRKLVDCEFLKVEQKTFFFISFTCFLCFLFKCCFKTTHMLSLCIGPILLCIKPYFYV